MGHKEEIPGCPEHVVFVLGPFGHRSVRQEGYRPRTPRNTGHLTWLLWRRDTQGELLPQRDKDARPATTHIVLCHRPGSSPKGHDLYKLISRARASKGYGLGGKWATVHWGYRL